MAEMFAMFESVLSGIGLIGLALLWGIKAAGTWMAYRWWKLKRVASAPQDEAGTIR